jgi:hypothetical protein
MVFLERELTFSSFFNFGASGDNLVFLLSPNPIASTGVRLPLQRDPFLLRLDYAELLTDTQHEHNLLFCSSFSIGFDFNC